MQAVLWSLVCNVGLGLCGNSFSLRGPVDTERNECEYICAEANKHRMAGFHVVSCECGHQRPVDQEEELEEGQEEGTLPSTLAQAQAGKLELRRELGHAARQAPNADVYTTTIESYVIKVSSQLGGPGGDGGAAVSTTISTITTTTASDKSVSTTATPSIDYNLTTGPTADTNAGVPTSTTNSNSADSTITAVSVTSTSSPQNAHVRHGLSTGAQVGIGVGAGLGGVLLILALLFMCLRHRRRGSQTVRDGAKYTSQAQSELSMVEAPRSMPPADATRNVAPAAVPLPQTRHDDDRYRNPYQPGNRASYYEPPGEQYEVPTEHYEGYEFAQEPVARPRMMKDKEKYQVSGEEAAADRAPPPRSFERPVLTIPGEDDRAPLHGPQHSREASPTRSVSPVSPVSPVSAMSTNISREASMKHDR